MAALAIKNLTRRPTPRLPFARALQAILPGWELSLVFVGETRARALNQKLRGKAYTPNVLSYEVSGQSAKGRTGEVLICLREAEREAPRYGMPFSTFVLYLFIHGLLHLKGGRHGATMERRERALVARFVAASVPRRIPPIPTHEKAHRNRHRHRHLPGQTGRRRRSR